MQRRMDISMGYDFLYRYDYVKINQTAPKVDILVISSYDISNSHLFACLN